MSLRTENVEKEMSQSTVGVRNKGTESAESDVTNKIASNHTEDGNEGILNVTVVEGESIKDEHGVENIPLEDDVMTSSIESTTAQLDTVGENSSSGQCTCNCHHQGPHENPVFRLQGGEGSGNTTSEPLDTNDYTTNDINSGKNIKEQVRNFKRSIEEPEKFHIKRNDASGKSLPTYDSLGEYILNDEPPKYQDVTGKEIRDLEESSTRPSPRIESGWSKMKKRIACIVITLAICCVTGLLVYLSITGRASSEACRNKSIRQDVRPTEEMRLGLVSRDNRSTYSVVHIRLTELPLEIETRRSKH